MFQIKFYSFLHECVLKFINVVHKLLIHLDFLHCDGPCIFKVIPHIIVLFVFNCLLKSGNHFTLPLNKLHFLLDSVKMSVVNILLSPQPFFLKVLLVKSIFLIPVILISHLGLHY